MHAHYKKLFSDQISDQIENYPPENNIFPTCLLPSDNQILLWWVIYRAASSLPSKCIQHSTYCSSTCFLSMPKMSCTSSDASHVVLFHL